MKRSPKSRLLHIWAEWQLQTILRDHNPRYYDLIQAFKVWTSILALPDTLFDES
jgi:predicted NodU family carbamoyl transferase